MTLIKRFDAALLADLPDNSGPIQFGEGQVARALPVTDPGLQPIRPVANGLDNKIIEFGQAVSSEGLAAAQSIKRGAILRQYQFPVSSTTPILESNLPADDNVQANRGGDQQPLLNEHYLREIFVNYLGLPQSKRLLDQIIFLQGKTQFKTLSILSCLPSEGRSFVALVLAAGYATLLNKQVLLVDAVQETRGRTLLIEKIMKSSLERLPSEGAERAGSLDLLSTRSALSARAESTDFYLPSFVDRARDDYDLIIYDTCPLYFSEPGNMDPVILSRRSDACLLLTSPKSANQLALLRRLAEDLKRWQLPVIGAIFNRCAEGSSES